MGQIDHVFLLFENSIEFYVGYYGIWQTGAVVAPLNTFLHEKEIGHIVVEGKPKAAVVSKKFLDIFKPFNIPLFNEDQMVDCSSDENYKVPSIDPDKLAALLYTSGTTGLPKGVMLSSRNIIMGMLQAIARLQVTEEERVFGVLPFFHSFAQATCIWGPPFVGATTIVVPHIDRHSIMHGLRHKPTVVIGVPGLFAVLCLLRNVTFDAVNYFVSGGDALPDKVRAGFELIYRRKLCTGYGLTESSPAISVELENEFLPSHCVGRPLIGVEVSIRDTQGEEVKRGDIGILWVKGANVMLGYYNAPDLTSQVLKDGWLDTGDFAHMDKDGRLYISGRFKDLIINKGVNIYPQEIENIILTHPAVMTAAVVGKPDGEFGETPVAFVALRHPTENIETELRELVMHNLAAYKVPKQFIILDSLPLTPLGKVDKKLLKAQYLKK